MGKSEDLKASINLSTVFTDSVSLSSRVKFLKAVYLFLCLSDAVMRQYISSYVQNGAQRTLSPGKLVEGIRIAGMCDLCFVMYKTHDGI